MHRFGKCPYNGFMDIKNKLENTYVPERQSRKERVVIGLSGGVDSLVTAYLLKIQKYDLVAVTVVNSWDEFNADQSKYFSCHINTTRLEGIKEFCHKLGIPLNIIKTGSEFKEEVVQPWIAGRILAKRPKQCWSCHELRLLLIYQKMREIGAQHMATGHYAKLFQNEALGTVFLHTSNDEEHDQSALLSSLPHEVLSSLILPLSDLTRKEVVKLGENFGLTHEEKTLKMHACLPYTPELKQILLKKIPKKFCRQGDIFSADGNKNYGQHDGVVGHTIGEPLEARDAGKQKKGILGSYSYQDRRLLIYEESFFYRNKISVKNCRFSEDLTFAEPLRGFLVSGTDYLECWVHPKSLSSVFVELTEKHKFIPGDVVSIAKKKGRNSKIFLLGEIELPPKEHEPKEGEKSVPKYIPAIDF